MVVVGVLAAVEEAEEEEGGGGGGGGGGGESHKSMEMTQITNVTNQMPPLMKFDKIVALQYRNCTLLRCMN